MPEGIEVKKEEDNPDIIDGGTLKEVIALWKDLRQKDKEHDAKDKEHDAWIAGLSDRITALEEMHWIKPEDWFDAVQSWFGQKTGVDNFLSLAHEQLNGGNNSLEYNPNNKLEKNLYNNVAGKSAAFLTQYQGPIIRTPEVTPDHSDNVKAVEWADQGKLNKQGWVVQTV